MIAAYWQAALWIGIYVHLVFALSLWLRRNDIADIAWGMGYLLVCAGFSITYPISHTALIVYAVITVWSLRLSFHIGLRNRGAAEDFRYRKWREEWGPHFFWRSWLQVFVLQGFFLLVIAAPLVVAASAPEQPLSLLSWIGLALWVIGFLFQAIGDWQLQVFRKNKKSKDAILQTGLWKFSRHPNYFGEALMWWGIWLMVRPLENGAWAIVSPVLITYLLRWVSGVPMLEKKYENNPAFREYQKKTSAFIPWFPKQ